MWFDQYNGVITIATFIPSPILDLFPPSCFFLSRFYCLSSTEACPTSVEVWGYVVQHDKVASAGGEGLWEVHFDRVEWKFVGLDTGKKGYSN